MLWEAVPPFTERCGLCRQVSFFVSGVRAAAAAPVAVEATMVKGLIGTNWTGVVDDFWVFNYVLMDFEVMTMYSTEGARGNRCLTFLRFEVKPCNCPVVGTCPDV